MVSLRERIQQGEVAYHEGSLDEAALAFEEALHYLKHKMDPTTYTAIQRSLLAMTLNNLAATYRALGRQVEAEPLLVECLPLCREVYGPYHLDVAIALNNLASLYVDLDKADQAEVLYLQALGIHQHLNELAHPNRPVFLKGLALVYEAKGQRSLAKTLREQALSPAARMQPGLLAPHPPRSVAS
jgi:tetratricopeptide (TPR) repeat protein